MKLPAVVLDSRVGQAQHAGSRSWTASPYWQEEVVSPGKTDTYETNQIHVPVRHRCIDVCSWIVAAATMIYKNVSRESTPAANQLAVPEEPLRLDAAAVRGSKDAKAVMIVYSDFQCPYCGRFARDILPEIERRYLATGRLAFAFRHLPLPNHHQAMKAAITAECAGKQDKFWEMHDLPFTQPNLDDQSLIDLQQSLKIDRRRFNHCLLDQAVSSRVKEPAEEADRLGIRAGVLSG